MIAGNLVPFWKQRRRPEPRKFIRQAVTCILIIYLFLVYYLIDMGFDSLRQGQLNEGFWGVHTATIDWCEQNYAFTRHVAEFFNTFSNIPFIALGLYGVYRVLSSPIPAHYALTYVGLTIIGLSSAMFHATLQWSWQLMDELPMIYLIVYSVYLLFDTLPGNAPRWGPLGPLAVIAIDLFITISYVRLPNPIYHQVTFAFIMISGVVRIVFLLNCLPRGHEARRRIAQVASKGLAAFVTGFAIWNIDNVFCNTLTHWREMVGFWGFLLEGHAWWHILTGWGSYLVFSSCTFKDTPDAYALVGSFLPVVEKRIRSPNLSDPAELK